MAKNTFVFTLTPELREVLNLFVREAGKNKAESSYPEAILADGQVLSCANASVSLRYQMGQDELGLMPTTFEKPVLIPTKGIKAILDSSANDEITISATATMISIVKSKKRNGKVQIAAFNGKEMPEFGKFVQNGIDKISVGDFIDTMNAVKHSISENAEKPIYTALFFSNDGKVLSFSAIDGFRASLVKTPYQSDEPFRLAIPRLCLDTVLNAASKKDRDDTISIIRGKDGRHAAFYIGSRLVIRTRLVDGEPVDVNTFIKDDYSHNVKVEKAEILSVIKSILNVKDDTSAITLTFKFTEKELKIDYKATVVALTDSVSMETEEENTDAITVGVNVDYLSDAVKAIASKKINFGFNSPLTPMLLSETDGKDNKQLVVPVRIAQ